MRPSPTLLADLEDACRRLAIPFEPERFGRFKADSRISPAHFSDYYDAETAARVAELCRFESEAFGYTLHGAAVGPRHPVRLGEQRI